MTNSQIFINQVSFVLFITSGARSNFRYLRGYVQMVMDSIDNEFYIA